MVLPPRTSQQLPPLADPLNKGVRQPAASPGRSVGHRTWQERVLFRVMESLHAAGQEAGRCYVTEIPNAVSPSDLDPNAAKGREEKKK